MTLEADGDFMSRIDFWPLEGVASQHLLVNVERVPFDDRRVRRALFLALDRRALVDFLGLGKGRAGSPMAPNNPYALPEAELLALPGYRQLNGVKHPDDIAEAQRLLAEAGFPNGAGLTTTILAPNVQEFPEAAQAISQQLTNNLGINAPVTLLDVGTWFTRVITGDFEMSLSGTGNFINDPDDRFQAIYLAGDKNWSRWSDPAVTELFALQQRELDPVRRRAINFEMQRLVLNGAPGTMEYWWKPNHAVISKRIKTVVGHYVVSHSLYSILKHEHEGLAPE